MAVLAVATWLLLWLFSPAAFAVIFALLLAACAAAKVVVSARWSGGVLSRIGRRGLLRLSAGVVMIAAAGGVGGAVAAGTSRDPCQAFEFDRSHWRTALAGPDAAGRTSDAERIARAIDRCGIVDGATRATVRRLLGGSQSAKRTTWSWPLGTANDALGPGDEQDLLVRFDRSGRARNVHLTYP